MRPPRAVLVVLAFLAVLAGCGDGPPSSLFNSSGYHVRGEKVYYLRAFPGDASLLETADAKTFKILDTTYAKDKNAVYLDGVELTEADPASFELLDEPNYARDAGHVFLRGEVLTTDLEHFEFIEDSGLTKDSAHVYSGGEVLSDDPNGFRIISTAEGYLFAADTSTVWVNGAAIEGADPGSFEVISGAYAEDDAGIYYFDDAVPDADASTFKPLETPYARDAEHVFWLGKVVPGADPESFEVLNANFECTADDEHAYYRDTTIADFDPGTIPEGATVYGCTETTLSFS